MNTVGSSRPETVSIVGLGRLGRGIATCLLARGLRVVALETSADARSAAAEYIAQGLAELVERGGFPPAITSEWRSRYTEATDVSGLASCDFVIESIVEDLDAKRRLFGEIEQVIRPDTPIASNTSALPITMLQQDRQHPARFVGMHWAEPCHLTRFLEVVRGGQTDDSTVEIALELGRAAGKAPSLVNKDVDGFIVNRLGYAMYREAFWLVENGVADVATIDRAFTNAFSVWANIAGPFRWMDLTGGSAYGAVMQRLFPLLSNSTEVPALMRDLMERNAADGGDGARFYEYLPGETEQWAKNLRENVWRVRDIQDELTPTTLGPEHEPGREDP